MTKQQEALLNFVYQTNNGGFSQYRYNRYGSQANKKAILEFLDANDYKELQEVVHHAYKTRRHDCDYERATIWNESTATGKEWTKLNNYLDTELEHPCLHSKALGY